MYYFGTSFEQDMAEATKSTGKKGDKPEQTQMKHDRQLALWLGDDAPKPKFRDPALEVG